MATRVICPVKESTFRLRGLKGIAPTAPNHILLLPVFKPKFNPVLHFQYAADTATLLAHAQASTGLSLILMAEKSAQINLQTISNAGIEFFGAIFPEVICDGRNHTSGAVLATLPDDVEVYLVNNMHHFDPYGFAQQFNNVSTVVAFVDAFSPNKVNFLEAMFQALAQGVKVIGGGAGKWSLVQEPVIFSHLGFHDNAALLLGIMTPIGLGLGHGWYICQGPFLVTESMHATLQSLDYGSAPQLYKQIVEAHSGLSFSENEFFELAKSYPIGIVKHNGEMVVRDPISCDDNSIQMLGELPIYSVVNVLKGDSDTLLQATAQMMRAAVADTNAPYTHALIIDCISRVGLLGSRFAEELELITKGAGVPAAGAIGLGEIASHGHKLFDFHNKTCVVGLL